VLASSLFELSKILELKDLSMIQASLCKKVKSQSRKLRSQYKRKSVSKLDYLQSQKEFNLCMALVENYEKGLKDAASQFEGQYLFSIKDFITLSSSDLYSFLSESMNKLNGLESDLNMEEVGRLKILNFQKKIQEADYQEAQASGRADLALDVRAGSIGVGNHLKDSHKSFSQFDNPYVYAGLNLALPLKSKEKSLALLSRKYKLMASGKTIELEKAKLNSRFDSLSKGLELERKILTRYEDSLKFSRSVYTEAQKDFDNGRLDFNDLINFSKSLISDQKNLSSYKAKLIVQLVELLDYHQFFDSFFTKQESKI